MTGPTESGPAKDLRAGDKFFEGNERLEVIKDAVQVGSAWVVVAKNEAGEQVRCEYADEDTVGI